MARLLCIAASFYIVLCPFTKVEESFNMQAFHDILYHRLNLSSYDHKDFPGVVPRTFIGPLFISFVTAPTVGILQLFNFSKFWAQYIVRYALAFTIIGVWSKLQVALEKRFGAVFALWFAVITATQYHFMFYISRPLPNIMAMPLVLLAFEGWMSGWHKQFLIAAGAAIVIFRSELIMLFGLFLIIDLYFKKIDPITLLKIVIPAGIGLVITTILVDSIFWGRLVWPELEVFWYNTVQNKSSDWGTSPFLWYWYSALPRGLGPSIVLVPFGMYLDRRLTVYIAPALVYVSLYSFLPHKELRFIMYVFPLFNIASAAACSYVYIRRNKAPLYELMFWGMVMLIVGNAVLSTAFVAVATTNYPGGVAIYKLHKLLKNESYVHLHIGNLAAQTGVTRFTELNDNWKYSKNESLEPHQLYYFTHLLIEAKSKYSPNLKSFTHTHTILDSVEAFSHITMNYKFIPPVRIKTKPSIFILERKDFREHPEGIIQEETINGENIVNSLVDETDTMYIGGFNSEDEKIVNVVDDGILKEKKDSKTSEEIEPMHDIESEENDNLATESDVETEKYVPNDEWNETQELEEPTNDSERTEENEVAKTKKVFDNIKAIRQERKQKAIAKIKSETRKKVVASAKEKLKEIMKRHKHIAEELTQITASEYVSVNIDKEVEEKEKETIDTIVNETYGTDSQPPEAVDSPSHTNENIEAIVEEVIVRLIDRKIYDDKTKPEDIKMEDRQIIQQIVEEVVAERMNYTKANKI